MAKHNRWAVNCWPVFAITVLVPGCTDGKKLDNPPTASHVETMTSGAFHKVTIRDDPPDLEDDPYTTNDESNDQPVGFYGTRTLCVYNEGSGSTYTLDADVTEYAEVEQIYFPKGGWLYFHGCELDENLNGYCSDDDGDQWEFQGEC